MKTMTQLIEELRQYDHIVMTGHIHPDGDCLGSSLGLYHILRQHQLKPVLTLESLNSEFDFLPGWSDILLYSEFEQRKIELGKYCMIVLDSGDITRFEPLAKVFEQAEYTYNVDHHISNTEFADCNIVDAKASSTAELIGTLCQFEQGGNPYLNEQVATCLYTGILTDTGLFRHDCTTARTHQVAATLIDTGIDFTDIVDRLFYKKSLANLRSLQLGLEHLEYDSELGLIMTQISLSDSRQHGIEKKDTESVVQLISQSEDAKIACFLLEMEPQVYKASFRSNSQISALEIAKRFGGGGHLKAAGCTIRGTYPTVRDLIRREVENEYKRND